MSTTSHKGVRGFSPHPHRTTHGHWNNQTLIGMSSAFNVSFNLCPSAMITSVINPEACTSVIRSRNSFEIVHVVLSGRHSTWHLSFWILLPWNLRVHPEVPSYTYKYEYTSLTDSIFLIFHQRNRKHCYFFCFYKKQSLTSFINHNIIGYSYSGKHYWTKLLVGALKEKITPS